MSDAADRLARVRDQMGKAARLAGRRDEDIRLIAVSKTRDEAAIEALIEAGQSEFGENRVQEAAAKWPAIRARHPHVRLHMIGQLQSNKASEAAALFDEIHVLDRASLRDALMAAGWQGPTWVQVNIGDEAQKGGVALRDLDAFLDTIRQGPLAIAGLMAIPPADPEPGPYFALLAKLARRHGVSGLSMGMSGDFPTAIMLGATAIRVGTALFED